MKTAKLKRSPSAKRTAGSLKRVVSLLAYLDKCAKPLETVLKNFKGSHKYKKWWIGEMRALNEQRKTAKALVKEKQANAAMSDCAGGKINS